MTCVRCGGMEWVCEEHPDRPMDHDGCPGPGEPCPVCNAAKPPRAPAGMQIDNMQSLQDMIEEILDDWDIEKIEKNIPEREYWYAMISGVVVDVLARILPEDSTARAEIIRKAEMLGVLVTDLPGPEAPQPGTTHPDVIALMDRLRSKPKR